MAFDYLETAQDALDVLADVGALATVTRELTAPADDLAAPTYPAAAPATASVTAYGAIFDYNANAYGNQPDALIRAGDRQLLLAALDVNGAAVTEAQLPIDATVTGPDGAAYVVKNIKPLAPAGVAVLFEIQVRRG